MPNIHVVKFLRDQAHELVKAIRSCPDRATVERLEALSAAWMQKASEVESRAQADRS